MAGGPTSIRLDRTVEREIRRIAEQRNISKAQWLRSAITTALEAERLAAKQSPTIVRIAGQVDALREEQCRLNKLSNQIQLVLAELVQTTAVERAADRVAAEQIFRMAIRAAFLAVRQISDDVGDDDRRDRLIDELCEQADGQFERGLTLLEGRMREARDACRATLARGIAP